MVPKNIKLFLLSNVCFNLSNTINIGLGTNYQIMFFVGASFTDMHYNRIEVRTVSELILKVIARYSRWNLLLGCTSCN